MNPTNLSCPSDISKFVITDYRPSKALYENVNHNNDYRLYMQRNARKIRNMNLQNFVKSMNCNCEPRQNGSSITPFDSSLLNTFEKLNLDSY